MIKLPMTLAEINQTYHLTEVQLEEWINAGRLKAARNDQDNWVILPEDLNSFLEKYLAELLDDRCNHDHEFQLLLEVMMTLCAIEARLKPSASQGKQPRILVIDDSPVIQKLGRKVLGPPHLNCDVAIAGNGYDACMHIIRNPVHLALIDIMMPKIDGLNLCRMLRSLEQTQDVGIVVISGMLNEDMKQRLSRFNVCEFVEKPFKVDELQEAVLRELRRTGWPF